MEYIILEEFLKFSRTLLEISGKFMKMKSYFLKNLSKIWDNSFAFSAGHQFWNVDGNFEYLGEKWQKPWKFQRKLWEFLVKPGRPPGGEASMENSLLLLFCVNIYLLSDYTPKVQVYIEGRVNHFDAANCSDFGGVLRSPTSYGSAFDFFLYWNPGYNVKMIQWYKL